MNSFFRAIKMQLVENVSRLHELFLFETRMLRLPNALTSCLLLQASDCDDNLYKS